MTQIFISYSHADLLIAKEITEYLERIYPHSVWIDLELRGGDEWHTQILEQVRHCDIFLFLMSREALESPYCLEELKTARENSKYIIPILVRLKADVPKDLQTLQIIDMSTGSTSQKSLADLIAAITKILQKNTPHPAVPVATQSTPSTKGEKVMSDNQGLTIAKLGLYAALITLVAAIIGLVAPAIVPLLTKATATTTIDQAFVTASTNNIVSTTGIPSPSLTTTRPNPTTALPAAPLTVDSANSVTVQRSGDTVAVCANAEALKTLVVEFVGENESYSLAKENVQSDCLCLQLKDHLYPVPGVCTAANTRQKDSSSTRANAWLNAPVKLLASQRALEGECPAQPTNKSVFTCSPFALK